MEPSFLHSDDLYLAIDQGGHSSRAIVFDGRGKVQTQAQSPVSINQQGDDRVEQDAEELVTSIRDAIDQVARQLRDDCRRVVAAGMATQRSSIACWNRNSGEALSPVISWQDRRADDWLQQFAAESDAIHQTTGLFLSAHYGASKLRWCLDHISKVRRAADNKTLAFGPMASFLLFRLLDESPILVDPANASRTLLWSLKTRNWDDHLLELFGIPRNALPDCVPTRYNYGQLDCAGHKVPMTILNGDQSAALFAYGPVLPESAYINIGTGAFVSRTLGHYPKQNRRLLTGIVLEEEDNTVYVTEGTVNGAASALDWAEQELDISNCIKELPAWLEQSQTPPLFINGVGGLGSPYWLAHFNSRFIGDGSKQEKMVAVIESIVFLLEANMQEMLKLASPPTQIQVSGGLSRLEGLCQRLADISQLPVYRPQEHEATARGTAYLLTGCHKDWPEPGFGDWFKPTSNQGLRQRYSDWTHEMMLQMRKQDM
jgi:glycerol kinase